MRISLRMLVMDTSSVDRMLDARALTCSQREVSLRVRLSAVGWRLNDAQRDAFSTGGARSPGCRIRCHRGSTRDLIGFVACYDPGEISARKSRVFSYSLAR